jgi:hypothetical protein
MQPSRSIATGEKIMYKYQVNFSKRFTEGQFKGRLYHSYLRFTDWKSADDFRKKCESGFVFEPCAGVSAYKAEDVILTAIEPMPA